MFLGAFWMRSALSLPLIYLVFKRRKEAAEIGSCVGYLIKRTLCYATVHHAQGFHTFLVQKFKESSIFQESCADI